MSNYFTNIRKDSLNEITNNNMDIDTNWIEKKV